MSRLQSFKTADAPEKHQTAEGATADTAGDNITLVTLLKESSKTTTTSSTQHFAMAPTNNTPPNTPHTAPQVMDLPIVPALDISAMESRDSPASHVIGQLPDDEDNAALSRGDEETKS